MSRISTRRVVCAWGAAMLWFVAMLPIAQAAPERQPAYRPPWSPAAPDALVCFATHNDGATVFAGGTFTPVQAAVNAAAGGATVKIAGSCAGTAVTAGTTQLVIVTKTLTLAGGYTQTDWSASYPLTQPTTLNAQGAGRVVFATMPISLTALRIVNGQVTGAGGGLSAASSAVILGSTFVSNSASLHGGGAYVAGNAVVGPVSPDDVTAFRGNSARSGGGLSVGGSAVIRDTFFYTNSAIQPFTLSSVLGTGGGLHVTGTLEMFGGGLFANTATWNGGGAYANGTAAISGTAFRRTRCLCGMAAACIPAVRRGSPSRCSSATAPGSAAARMSSRRACGWWEACSCITAPGRTAREPASLRTAPST